MYLSGQVPGSWHLPGSSGRVPSSGGIPGSGGVNGFGWVIAPTGVHEPVLVRPQIFGNGPNWNAQPSLPETRTGKTHLKFLGFYPEDGNYRSVHVGG